MSLPTVASRQNGSTSFRSEQKNFSSDLDVRPKGGNNESAKKELSKVASENANATKVKISCRRTCSSPVSRENSSTALKPHRKFGETRIRWREDEKSVQNLTKKFESKIPSAAVGLHNVAAAKILGRNWQQRNQQHKLVSNLKNVEPQIVEVLPTVPAKKKYKTKKHSLSSPSLGKYSPMLLRKVFQQQQKDHPQLAKVEVRIEEEDETSFGQLWASEMSRIRGEEKRIGGVLEERERDNEEAFPFASGLYPSGENKNNFSSSSSLLFGGTFSNSNSNSCSLAVLQQEQRLAVPVVAKKKKKSIISSLSLGQKELPKKLVAVQQNFVNANNQIWNRRQAVKKSRKSIASFSCVGSLISEPILENDPTVGSVIHCSDPECCCHLRKSRNVGCVVCSEESKPRKKSSILSTLSRLPISAKRQQALKDQRKMILGGKTTVRMNSEPLLGRRATQQKHSLSMGETSNGPPKTGLVPRRDFGPAAGHHRHPMLRFSRGSWISKPTEENPTEKLSVPKKLSLQKSTRRHSAPPVSSRQQSVTFFKASLLKTMSVKDVVERGTINLPLWKLVKEKNVRIFLFIIIIILLVDQSYLTYY